ncbi:unnamed protein product [Rotaria magnacalcarata]|uniref:Uncharacterized protein n=4 Tax=Rotaria magnacalcarata TaxID=392030 RepID=A0A819GYG4_9BILA|nr:unnamed protein product [Rotaria magnacalcarata]CAF3941220.1 unnamed protein product [Rotaria magnacalcarata]
MYNRAMLFCQHILLCLLSIQFLSVRPSILLTRISITLTTPNNTSLTTKIPYAKISTCQTYITEQSRSKGSWYDNSEEINCDQSMLIYEWTPYSSPDSLRIPNGLGFNLSKYRSIMLSVVYTKESEIRKEQSGVILHIATKGLRFQMGTILAGNERSGKQFSCRSKDDLRLLYGVKRLNANANYFWWRIYVVRIRRLRQKLIQIVSDSRTLSNTNQSGIEMISSEIFLREDDYLLIECENVAHASCYFLIYYSYKYENNKNYNICQDNDFSHLFKVLPQRHFSNMDPTIINKSPVDGSTMILLLSIWVSIIIGCIILRRIRGLVNFRTETTPPFSSQKNAMPTSGRTGNDNYQQRTGEVDQMMQIDVENAGLVN